ncbi:unnamed protein product [Haemonchus placei]|uniref:Secreted protein n=1 Tax=Haemonchus placei TaxID=6290 RepID=A0A0N4VWV1_HAEPC|nr:unnamed protein product [Haemonchus placei]
MRWASLQDAVSMTLTSIHCNGRRNRDCLVERVGAICAGGFVVFLPTLSGAALLRIPIQSERVAFDASAYSHHHPKCARQEWLQ